MNNITDLPRVTFIIPHRNYQKYLTDCILSAKNQDYKGKINICVIDDCSDDKNLVSKIVKNDLFEGAFSQEMCYIGLIEEDGNNNVCIYLSGGPYKQGYARNCGITYCWNNTDVFCLLDSDDTVYSNKISTLITPIIEFPNKVGAVYGDYDTIRVDDKKLTREYKEVFDPYKLAYECIVHSGSLIPKYALEAVVENGQFFDKDLPPCEDYDMWIRIAEHFVIIHVPQSLSLISVHRENSTNTTTHEHRVRQLKRINEKRVLRYNNG